MSSSAASAAPPVSVRVAGLDAYRGLVLRS